MLGIVFQGDRTLELQQFPDPTPGPGEVVLEIKASGMCGSDLHVYRQQRRGGAKPVIAGHEPCGVVVAAGPGVSNLQARVGERVMVHHYRGCSVCEDCRSGWPQMCQAVPMVVYGSDDHGAHAPFMRVAANTLVALNEELSFAAGAAISCGTGTAWGAFERMGISGRDTIAIFGQGPVGLSATLLAKAQGARVIAFDIDESRRASAKAFGADDVFDPREVTVRDAVKELTAGRGSTMALETSGAASASEEVLNCVRPWGTVGLVGIGSELRFSLATMLRQQLRILPSWTMSITAHKSCADFVVERKIDLDALFTHRWQLSQAEEAYKSFDMQSGGKGVFEM
jgi:2-desacetyl-2-hydroxyethyl bacteriochlorophyllide A dehydrogenase